MSLTIGSLFAGIGGLELGLERAGLGPTVWQVEKDAYCRAVLAKHWPDATRYEDVKDVGAANLVPVDVICGGFPCQDISIAGKREGIEGERSGLWSEYARIVRELRPRYIVVENVARLLADGMGRVLGDLAALGYDAEWDCLPASAVGAPHRRDRVFVVAYAGCERRESRGATGNLAGSRRALEGEAQERQRRGDAAGNRGADFSHPIVTRLEGHERRVVALADVRRHNTDVAGSTGWGAEPEVGRLAHGLPARLVRSPLAALGNAVVPQVAEVVGRIVMALEAERGIEA